MSSPFTTLLTGSTGFIGQYVLRDLLQRGQRVVVLLRGPVGAGRIRLASLVQPLGLDLDHYLSLGRLVIASGSLPHDLPEMTWGHTDSILHCAACLQLENDDRGEPFMTNVDGVKAIACWADRYQVDDFHLVSTAYTCGRDCTQAFEIFHTPQPRFGTDYELSKWQAEQWARQWADRSARKLTVLRPGLVIGDSQTGYTTQYGGYYQLARMIEVISQFFRDQRQDGRLCLPLRIPADADARQNLVPVDYVASAIAEIISRYECHGQTYHLTNPTPPTNQEVKTWLENYYHVYGGYFVQDLDRTVSESLAENMFLQMSGLIFDQMHYTPQFDCTNTLNALVGTAIAMPQLNQSISNRFLRYAQSQQWGRQSHAVAS